MTDSKLSFVTNLPLEMPLYFRGQAYTPNYKTNLPRGHLMKKFILLGLAVAACATTAAANCPTVLADAAKGKYPNQYDLQEFETAHNCKLNFSGNHDAAALNK